MPETRKIGKVTYVKRDSGLWMNAKTTEEQAEIIERAERLNLRIRIHYGDPKTGRDWGDTKDVEGNIGRSTGRMVVPLLRAKVRSIGGTEIMTANIVRVRFSNRRDGGDLYIHPKYNTRGIKVPEAEFNRHFAPSETTA